MTRHRAYNKFARSFSDGYGCHDRQELVRILRPPHPADVSAVPPTAVTVRWSSHSRQTCDDGAYPCALCSSRYTRVPIVRQSSQGLPTLRLHLAQSHPLHDEDFPALCPLCIDYNYNVPSPPEIQSAHAFKIHRLPTHLQDRPIALAPPP